MQSAPVHGLENFTNWAAEPLRIASRSSTPAETENEPPEPPKSRRVNV